MKKLNVVLCLVMAFSFSGCTSNKPKITLDLSDYTQSDGEEMHLWSEQRSLLMYADESCTEQIGYEEEANERTFDYYLDEDVKDVYVRLPIMVQPVSIPEQTIKVKNGKAEENDYVTINSITVGELGHENIFYTTAPYSIRIAIENQESTPMSMYYHVNGEDMEATYINWSEDETKRIYHVELEEEDQSLLKEATITFDMMGKLLYTTEDMFSSDDVNIHFVD